MAEPALALGSPDATTLTVLPTAIVRRYDGSVEKLDTDAAGRVLVAGGFTHVDGQLRPGLARFLTNGTLDAAFLPVAAKLIMLPSDGRPIVRRESVGPIESDGYHRYISQIARLQTDGSLDPSFSFPTAFYPPQTNFLVSTVDGRLLVSAFDPDSSSEDNLKLIWIGTEGQRLATLSTRFAGISRYVPPPDPIAGGTGYTVRLNSVYSAEALADGRVVIAGSFFGVNGIAGNLARLLGNGMLDPSYSPDLVRQDLNTRSAPLPLPDGRALVFGYAFVNGQRQPRTFRLRADGSDDSLFQPAPETVASGARRLTDGSFFSYGRRYLENGWLDLNFAPRLRSALAPGYAYNAVRTGDGALWVSGAFDSIDGQPRTSLARFLPKEIVAITVPPTNQQVVAGRDALFQVAIGTTQPAIFRWTRDGVTVPGATTAILRLSAVCTADAGVYRAVDTVGAQAFTSAPAALTVVPSTAWLTNFSARSVVSPDTLPQIAGVVCAGAPPRPVLLRAVGRGLAANIGAALLPVPVLTLYDGGETIAQDRGSATAPTVDATARAVGAFPLRFSSSNPPGSTLGSALTPTFGAGTFTAITTSGDGGTGLSLFEFYDTAADGAPALVRNLAIRGSTAPGAAVLTAGFVIAGHGPLRLLVRGIGPALAPFGLSGTVSDPRLDVFAAGWSNPLASNTGWAGDPDLADAARRSGAFALPPGSRDAAVLLTLEPGAYTAQLTSASGATGTAMIEIYVVQD